LTIRILVSDETDDEAGHIILGNLYGVKIVPYSPGGPSLSEEQRKADVLIPPYRSSHRPISLLSQLRRLRMVQLLSAGADEWAPYVPNDVLLSSARGAHAGPVSEWVLSAILAQLRQWPALTRFQDQAIWAHRKFEADTLAGKRVLVVGAGSIGMAVAQKLSAFDASTTLVASKPREDVHGPEDLKDLIGRHSIVVLTMPLNDRTRKLVGSDFLRYMQDGALLVNAGRGQVVDTEALIAELSTGRIRAALDVTDPEPLPAEHPLWRCPGVIISPHSARTVPGTNKLCYSVAADQVAAWLAGLLPANSVVR
jgi:phosphoglycerate dehydrogenase-like enzyme